MEYQDQKHYARLYREVEREFAFDAQTPAEVEQWQAAFRPRLRQALGLAAMTADLDGHVPTAVCRRTKECEGYTEEHWELLVEPTVPLPFYVLRPDALTAPAPLVFTPHGHNVPGLYVGHAENEDQRRRIVEGDRDIAVQAARHGYLALAPTTRAFGATRTADDREDDKLCSCRTNLLHGLLVGRTAIGERVWDISRLLDWACDNLPVDTEHVAITGNSGGGTVSVFAAACEPRIRLAVPSCYFCTFAGSIGTLHHCECNYVPGILRLGEMYEVAGLIAPRPVCMIAGRDDPIFPFEHVKYAFAQLQRVYAAAGVPDHCQLYVGDGGHRYYRKGAWPFVAAHFES